MRLTSLLKKVPKTHYVQLWTIGEEGKYPVTFIEEARYIKNLYCFSLKGKDVIEVDVDLFTDLDNITNPYLKILAKEVPRHDSR